MRASYLTSTQRALLMQTLDDILSACERENLTCMMSSGTLLGSYRHHGLIPWDEDVDILFDLAQQPAVDRALSALPGYIISKRLSNIHWKLYHSTAMDVGGLYRFPFVDLFFYYSNATHVHSERDPFTLRVEQVFPLVRRPFEQRWLWAPRDSLAALQQAFGADVLERCEFGGVDHAHCVWRVNCSLPCAALYDLLPFVFRKSPGKENAQLPMETAALTSGPARAFARAKDGPAQQLEVLRIGKKELNRLMIYDTF